MSKRPKLGATGKYPQGKLNKDDEGELVLAVGHDQNTVTIEFGTPVAWLAMSKQEALEFAAMIAAHARE